MVRFCGDFLEALDSRAELVFPNGTEESLVSVSVECAEDNSCLVFFTSIGAFGNNRLWRP